MHRPFSEIYIDPLHYRYEHALGSSHRLRRLAGLRVRDRYFTSYRPYQARGVIACRAQRAAAFDNSIPRDSSRNP